MCHRKKERRRRIIIRNGAKTISLQTLFGRLIKVSLLVKVGDENCSCLTNFIVKCNWPYSLPLSKLYCKHQQCKIKIKVLKNVIRTIDGSSMLVLRRDDLQLFLIHYSFFVCFILLYMGNIEFKIDSMFYNMPTVHVTISITNKFFDNVGIYFVQ